MIYQSPYTRDLGVNTCADCFEKQLEIDRLRVEVKRLKGLLHYRRQAAVAAPFGSSTPSSKILVKPNTPAEETIKHGGAHVGHAGHGRRAVKASEVPCIRRVRVAETACPQCGKQLITKGWCERSVLEMPPVVVEPVLYRLQKAYCAGCRHSVTARAPGVLAHTLLSNQLSAHILTSHYLHGEPLGRISERLGLKVGSLIGMAHRVAGLFQGVVKHLSDEYRRSPVRHADETGWRTDGQNGYAWLFSTASLSIFLFRRTRSSSVAKEILGTHPLNGVLVVDRYHAYNRAPVALQYCYVHLLRETQDLGSEFPDDTEVQAFTSAFAPLLVRAIALRTKQLREALASATSTGDCACDESYHQVTSASHGHSSVARHLSPQSATAFSLDAVTGYSC